ncbi:Uncharacterized protein APZ42_003726 [Daphnia magna]|uniref:Uncharacterized protein n=1 Tax=Daphnia magna TaxID=35525 RepID=A0A168EJJ6_9CRUS|nr:Uncharacterized protein APZ42_003726 [Daphnia magna]
MVRAVRPLLPVADSAGFGMSDFHVDFTVQLLLPGLICHFPIRRAIRVHVKKLFTVKHGDSALKFQRKKARFPEFCKRFLGILPPFFRRISPEPGFGLGAAPFPPRPSPLSLPLASPLYFLLFFFVSYCKLIGHKSGTRSA